MRWRRGTLITARGTEDRWFDSRQGVKFYFEIKDTNNFSNKMFSNEILH
jgi:hypothetical protein